MGFIVEELGELGDFECTAKSRTIVELNVGKQVSLGKVRKEGVSLAAYSERVAVSVAKNVIQDFWG